MTSYLVTVCRTEHIVFMVDADSPEEAESTWAMEGEEMNADVVESTVINVKEAT